MTLKKFFSRSDGTYLKKVDPFIRFFPYIMRGRNESAVYFTQQIDISQLRVYLNQYNHQIAISGHGHKATIFHAVLAALVKAAYERPQMNRFVIGRRLYQRNELSCAFVIKREFKDDAKEEIAILRFAEDDTLSSIAAKIQDEVKKVRQEAKLDDKKRHGAVNWFNYLMNLPRIVLRGMVAFLRWLDYHGWLPHFVIAADPMHASFFLSNLASLNVDAPYHHLYEWGTTSIFMTMGVSKKIPVVTKANEIEIREVMNMAFTLDERISDGFYYARSIKRFQQLLENPELLDKPPRKKPTIESKV